MVFSCMIMLIFLTKESTVMQFKPLETYHVPRVEWTTLEPLSRVLNNSIDPTEEDDEIDWED